MKKRLYLIRHAAAKDTERGSKDFDRILLPEGARNASMLGRKFFKDNKSIDLILSSPATRAADTAILIAEQMRYDTNRIQYPEVLYEASVREMLIIINELPEDYKNVMIIGHNPTISYFAEYITNEDVGSLSVGGMAAIGIKPFWNHVSQGTGNVEFQLNPGQLSEDE